MHQIKSTLSQRRVALQRRGSTLVIVIALLGMLAFLGFVFYTFAKQERANAASFSEAAKNNSFSVDTEEVLDFALQQIILGPPDTLTQSILWGGRHSFLANMFGRDGIPWNGEGVNLLQDSTGMPYVDMNYNGEATDSNDNQGLLPFVDSPAANAGNWHYGTSNVVWGTTTSGGSTYYKMFRGSGTLNQSQDIPEPDANYSSPDINSTFLTYDGIAVGAGGANPTRVIIPSYLRPQYLRTTGTPTAQPIQNWFNTAAANQMMRPHPQHYCVDASGNPIYASGSLVPRFVGPSEYTTLGMLAPFTTGTGTSAFAPVISVGGVPTLSAGNLGIWNSSANPVTVNNPTYNTTYQYTQYEHDLDVDTDGDGILDAILMDLGYPPIPRSDGVLVVPLFAISIRDLNGLLNVNASGNVYGNVNLNPLNTQDVISNQNQLGFRQTGGTWSGSSWSGATYVPDNLSKSNQGLSPSEINIQRALTVDPVNDATLLANSAATQLSYFLSLFDSSITSPYNQPGRSVAELANLEWLLLNIGNATFSTTTHVITSTYAGRYSELTRYSHFLTTGAFNDLPKAGLSTVWASGSPTNWSYPPSPSLNPNPDDNFNYNEGEGIQAGNNYNTRYGTPLDFRGSGQQFHRYYWGADGQPGTAGVDDDNDGVIDNFSEEGWAGTDDATPTLTPLHGKYPALQQFNSNIAAGYAAINNTTKTATMYPLYWPAYSGYHSFYGNGLVFSGGVWTPNTYGAGGVKWGEYESTSSAFYPLSVATTPANLNGLSLLMRGSHSDSLLDDPTELVIDPILSSSSYQTFLNSLPTLSTAPYPLTTAEISGVTNAVANDSALGVQESLFLQGMPADVQKTNTTSRLSQLMPGNLVASQNAADIRKRLTSISQDRREFGVGTPFVGGSTTSTPTVTTPTMRLWESSVNGFPPYSSATTATAPNPYRTELYNFLQQVSNTNSPSLKLNVNRWLYQDGSGHFPSNTLGFAPLPEQTSVNDTNATLARQLMARDIYTLLYTLCCVHGTSTTSVDLDYRTVLAANVPTRLQAKEMAQFAINLVDSLDSDGIITAFYYDPDLSNNNSTNNQAGWDPLASAGPNGTPQDYDDYVVYGVERQQLVISEATAFTVSTTAPPNAVTIFDPRPTQHTYLFFELQNVSPMTVTLAPSNATWSTAKTTCNWRVSLIDTTPAGINPSTGQPAIINQVYFLPGLDSTHNYATLQTIGGSTNVVIPPNGLFSVASQDGNDLDSASNPRTSDFRYSTTASGLTYPNPASYPLVIPGPNSTAYGTPETTVPTGTSTAGTFKPACNLDLVWTNGMAQTSTGSPSYGDATALRFWLLNGSNSTTGLPTSPGAFISGLTGKATTRLSLETQAAAGPNPYPSSGAYSGWTTSTWVSVDNTSNTSPTASGASPDIQVTVLPAASMASPAVSYPRSVPLLSGTAPASATINTINSASTTSIGSPNMYTWQLQNDREFGSLGELLQLPLYGPDSLTAALAQVVATSPLKISTSEFYSSKNNFNLVTNVAPSPCMANMTGAYATPGMFGASVYYPSIAAARFLRPDNPDYTLNGPTPGDNITNAPTNYGNRWYRLLDFLEVPSRNHQHQAILGIPPVVSVTPSAQTVSFGTANTTAVTPNPVTFTYPGVPGSTAYAAASNLLAGPFNYPQFFGWPTAHGQINLNMIRHPQVLNALLDNDQLINDPRFVSTATQFLDDATGDTSRQWWVEFLKSRESRSTYTSVTTPTTLFSADPVTGLYISGGLYVPGTAAARPFRGLDVVGTIPANNTNNDSPIEDTIFRSLPLDATASTNPDQSRRLFEVGSTTASDFYPFNANPGPPSETQNTPLHPTVRHQLLSKIMNNTTTRSNSYAVYITVQYYEAVQVQGTSTAGSATAIRIGGQLTDVPTNRSFFVIDRTGAIDQMKILEANVANGTIPPQYIPNTTTVNPHFPVSAGSYSFQPNTDTSNLRSKMNGIRWRDLVLYRQTLN